MDVYIGWVFLAEPKRRWRFYCILLWKRPIWSSSQCRLLVAELCPLLAVTFLPTGLSCSFSETWLTWTRRAASRRGRPGTKSRCGGWRTKRTRANVWTSSDRPPCTCRWSGRGAGTTRRPFTCSPRATGKLYINSYSSVNEWTHGFIQVFY